LPLSIHPIVSLDSDLSGGERYQLFERAKANFETVVCFSLE